MMELILVIIVLWAGISLFPRDKDAKYRKRWPDVVSMLEFSDKHLGAKGQRDREKIRNMMKKGLKDEKIARKLDQMEDNMSGRAYDKKLDAIEKHLRNIEQNGWY